MHARATSPGFAEAKQSCLPAGWRISGGAGILHRAIAGEGRRCSVKT